MSTAVFFHAHPDDEVLLTGGTMAALAGQGHRVVLVVATDGEAGLAADRYAAGLGAARAEEVRAAGRILGCARVVLLGYGDSGEGDQPRPGSFAQVPVDEAARRLAEIVDDERAALLTGYDPAGGYGHRDHVQTHRVARAAAQLAGTALLLEATVDRRALQRALRATRFLTRDTTAFAPSRFQTLYSDPAALTHCAHVGSYSRAKRDAMRAHVSQASSEGTTRTLERFGALPLPLFRLVFGREWYVQPGTRRPGRRLLDPVRQLAAVRPR